MKGREEGKPMPLLCSSILHAGKIGKLDVYAQKLAERFWPGALTIIVELTDRKISVKVTGGTGTVGVRVPSHKCALHLITACGGVLVGTSANRSGFPPSQSADDVTGIQDFDILLDGGMTAGVESTIVKVIDSKITIIREGQVKRQEIEEVLGLHV
jgi:L-threonylcarbamoyladenylate synthase